MPLPQPPILPLSLAPSPTKLLIAPIPAPTPTLPPSLEPSPTKLLIAYPCPNPSLTP